MTTVQEAVGYDLTSVWPRAQDATPKFKPHALKVPEGHQRTPFHTLERVVRTYMRPGDVFLETCAGWGTFSCTAVMHGYAGSAVDLWGEAVNFLRAQRLALPEDAHERLSVEQGNALALDYPDDTFDYAYSSLPVYRLHKYSADPRALERSSTRAEWKARTVALFAETARVVKPGGLVTVVVADRREKGYLRAEHADYIAAAEAAGLGLHDIAVQHVQTQQTRYWRQSYGARHTAKAHEYLLTFWVGDHRRDE